MPFPWSKDGTCFWEVVVAESIFYFMGKCSSRSLNPWGCISMNNLGPLRPENNVVLLPGNSFMTQIQDKTCTYRSPDLTFGTGSCFILNAIYKLRISLLRVNEMYICTVRRKSIFIGIQYSKPGYRPMPRKGWSGDVRRICKAGWVQTMFSFFYGKMVPIRSVHLLGIEALFENSKAKKCIWKLSKESGQSEGETGYLVHGSSASEAPILGVKRGFF